MYLISYCSWQVVWNPYVGITDRPNFVRTTAITQTRRLFLHEYGYVFYLGERAIRKYALVEGHWVPHLPPAQMRSTSSISVEERQQLWRQGTSYLELSTTEDYGTFAARYLLQECRGQAPERYYARNARSGGDSRLIRGYTYIMIHCIAPDGTFISRLAVDEFFDVVFLVEPEEPVFEDVEGDGGDDGDGADGAEDVGQQVGPQHVAGETDSEAEAVEADVELEASFGGEDSTERASTSSRSDHEYVPSASDEEIE